MRVRSRRGDGPETPSRGLRPLLPTDLSVRMLSVSIIAASTAVDAVLAGVAEWPKAPA